MKKKFSLWVNLAVICLCVCAIAIGVYAASSASLTVSGQLGFKAHDCTLEVSATKQGYSLGDGTTYQTTAERVKMDNDTGDAQYVGIVAGNGGTGTISSVDLGSLNFTDMAGDEIPPIIITLTAKNISGFQVSAMVTVKSISNVIPTREYSLGTSQTKAEHSSAVILDNNASATFTITLRVSNPEQEIASTANNLNISASFSKYDPSTLPDEPYKDTVQGITYTLNDDNASWSVKGDCYVEQVTNSIITKAPPVEEESPYVFTNNVKVPNIVIPEELFGLPVTKIADNAFGFDIAGWFCGCTNVTSVTIPNSITSIGNYAFYSTGLKSVNIPESVTSIGNYAFSRTNLTGVTIGSGVETIGDSAFNYCNSLTNVNIPNSVTSIGNSAFNYCHNLTSVTIGDGVETIGDSAFYGCSGLTSITIPNNVTSIGNSAFKDCNGLTSVTIGSGLETIGAYVFYGCLDLTSVTFNGTTPPTFGSDVFGAPYGNYFDVTNLKIYVPVGSGDAYSSKVTPSGASGKVEEKAIS